MLAFDPVADAFVDSSRTTDITAASTRLQVRESGSLFRSYLTFQVSGLGGPVTSARLRLYVMDGSPEGGSVYAVSAPWDETTLSWATAPAISGTPIGTLGAVSAGTWAEVQLAAGAIGSDGTYRFALKKTGSELAVYGSRESMNPPQLVLSQGGAPDPPVADFVAGPTSGPAPLSVAFRDLSAGAPNAWAWDFGDDGSVDSGARSPYHTFATPGTYDVRLTVSGPGGQATTLRRGLVVVSDGPAAVPDDAVLAGAGDIGDCGSTGDEATSLLIDGIPGTVFTLGDNAYPSGSAANFSACFDPAWGRHRNRTRPSPGNHDYGTAGASGYFGYFGAAGGDPATGYYSYDLGGWHVIALNSNCSAIGGCGAGSPEEVWLRADLAAHPAACTVAYWHHPLFSSAGRADRTFAPFWQALYDAGADLVLNGHEHVYERFAPQDPSGRLDPGLGLRQIVVGVGGHGQGEFNVVTPNSERRDDATWGVLRLSLHATGYTWQFVPVAGETFSDAGSGACH